MKRPELFQYVTHTVRLRDVHVHRGLVTNQLSTMFMYTTAAGTELICSLSEDWQTMAKRTNQPTVVAPAIWRDHESRTCIVLSVIEGTVSYVPMRVDAPFAVEECQIKEFTERRYLEPIDYPVSRAAKLFVEYARNTGATEEVLDALASFTNLTDEERTMARARANTAEDTPKTTRRKTSGKKAAAKSTAKTAKANGTRKPRESAAAVYREQIMAGKSVKQVVAAVNKKFPDKGRDDYVKWYYKDLVKKGEQPPVPKGLDV